MSYYAHSPYHSYYRQEPVSHSRNSFQRNKNTEECYAHSSYHSYNRQESITPYRNSSQRNNNTEEGYARSSLSKWTEEYYERVETTRTVRNNVSVVRSDSNNRLRRTSKIKCSKCCGHGHYSRDCPNRRVVFINSDGQYESQDEEEEIPVPDDDLIYGEPGEILSLAEDSPKVVPQSIPESSLCETPQRVVSSVQKEESKEEEIVQHPSVDCPTVEHQTTGNIRSESPIEFPQSSPMINKDDLAIVSYHPTHPVLPKLLQPHLVQREDWPKNFFSLKEFPQSGNSILAIQIGEPLRVLQYLNDGTNNFELLAEIQFLPALDADSSSTFINITEVDEQSPEIFQGGGNNAVIPKTAKSDTCFAQEQPPIIFFQSRDVRRFGGTVQGFLIKEPFQESGNDEVITSLPGDGVHPASIDHPITQSLTRKTRELKQLVQFRAYCFKGGTF